MSLKFSLCFLVLFALSTESESCQAKVNDPVLIQFCADCHSGADAEAGFDLQILDADLSNPIHYSRWVQIYDRMVSGEMPPKDASQLRATESKTYLDSIKSKLTTAHREAKGTVLRRLNRVEYENTINDIFGTQLKLSEMLPEDGRTHEFDNVGASLGISMVHLQSYIDAMNLVLDTSIQNTIQKPETKSVTVSYKGTPEYERFVGKVWQELSDGSIVRFEGGGYPSGMMRGTGVRTPGRYRFTIRGYAFRSSEAISFSAKGTSFRAGSEKPIYGFFSFQPGTPDQAPQEVTFETWVENNYMLAIEPHGISDPKRYQRQSVDDFDGPGLAIHSVIVEGPLVDQWPSPGHQLLFSKLDRQEIMPRNPRERERSYYKPRFEVTSKNPVQDVRPVLKTIATKAFRRPVTADEVEPYVKLFLTEFHKDQDFEGALRTATAGIFCSPAFLYFNEQPGPLDDYAIATRLAYFLTRTTPDDELLSAAAAGNLHSPVELKRQTERLLADPRFESFVMDFTQSWLNLRDMDFTAPDRSLFPEFDEYLRYSMPLETEAFLRELIEGNHGIRSLVASDFVMINSRLAEHYELPTVSGAQIRKVKLPRNHIRGGFLTQASILKVSANGTNTSPVMRGVFVMERILGQTPPPPPPGVPGVEPDIRGAETLRALLEKHRSQENCQACHQKIDPPGFALEVFNPIGGYRDFYRSLGGGEKISLKVNGRPIRYRRGPEVDSSGETIDGQPFTGYAEFRNLIAEDEALLAQSFVEKLLTFATGREMGFSDREIIEKIVVSTAAGGYRIQDLLHASIRSEIFLQK